MRPGKMFRVVQRAGQMDQRGAVSYVQIDRVGDRRVAQREQSATDETEGDRRGRISAVCFRQNLTACKKLIVGRYGTRLYREIEIRLVARQDDGAGAVIDNKMTDFWGMGGRGLLGDMQCVVVVPI